MKVNGGLIWTVIEVFCWQILSSTKNLSLLHLVLSWDFRPCSVLEVRVFLSTYDTLCFVISLFCINWAPTQMLWVINHYCCCCCYFFLSSETGFYYIAWAGFELTTIPLSVPGLELSHVPRELACILHQHYSHFTDGMNDPSSSVKEKLCNQLRIHAVFLRASSILMMQK